MSRMETGSPAAKRYPQTILATACVPWTKSYTFDEAVFRRSVRLLLQKGIRHIYLFGTAGEGYAVTDAHFNAIVRAFAEEMNGPDMHPMVGLISLSFVQMKERLKIAYEYGIRDFQFALPSWGSLSDTELSTFVHELCDPWPDCRFLHYNLMRAKRLLTIREYEKLAEEVPNLAGVKYSSPDIQAMLAISGSRCPLRFFLTEYAFGYGAMVGDFGFLISIASTGMKRAWEYFGAGLKGDKDTLLGMQRELYALGEALAGAAGGGKIDGAYDKIFCRIGQPDFPLRLLPPYEGTSEAGFLQYSAFLREKMPQWLDQ
jgi:dihydrodipicolinate synthase/N-acetylneuraminate lyase